MSGHRGIPGTVRVAHTLSAALAMWTDESNVTDVGHDARTGGAYFRARFLGHRYTIRITEVDE